MLSNELQVHCAREPIIITDDYRPHPKPITKMERFASKWKDTRDINRNNYDCFLQLLAG